MMPQISKETLQRIEGFLDIAVDNFYYGGYDDDRSDLCKTKFSLMAGLMLLQEFNMCRCESFHTYVYFDSDSSLDGAVDNFCHSLSDFWLDKGFSLLSDLGWELFDEDSFEAVRAEVDDFQWDFEDDVNEMGLTVLYNKSWKKFFDYIRQYGPVNPAALEKVKESLPEYFLAYYFTYDEGGDFPEYGYYRKLTGFDGENELGIGAFSILFPFRVLVCEYYMWEIINAEPKLREYLGV